MRHIVHTIPLPADSMLHTKHAPGDFLDCYTVLADIPARQAAEIITDFPGWVTVLLKLRGMIVAPLGLLADGSEVPDKLGPFPVDTETPYEVTAGFNDHHLNFRVSVLSRDGQVSLATWVHRHNWMGRVYLAVIMPFHIAISRNALRRVAHAATKTP